MPQNVVKSPRRLAPVRRLIVLTSEVTVAANSTKSPDLLRLKNPTGEHFVIREIRFSLRSAPTAGVPDLLTGGAVAVKLDLGTQPLTNAHVPVWSFGRYISRDADAGTDLSSLPIRGQHHLFRWKLQHPLYVPAGGGLACEFQHRGTVPSPIVACATYLGHTFDAARAPQRISLPWVTSYSSKSFSLAGADSDVSAATALINPFDTPVLLERFTGRLTFLEPATGVNRAFSANHTLLLRISHSSGAPLVREFTPFRQVFGAYSHSWEQRGHVFAPGTHYLVTIDKQADADEDPRAALQADIGIVGWRNLEIVGSTK